jgi:hypothetical protein
MDRKTEHVNLYDGIRQDALFGIDQRLYKTLTGVQY